MPEIQLDKCAGSAYDPRMQYTLRNIPKEVDRTWIAALVVEHDLRLFSRDSHFRHLPQLQLF